MQRRDFITTTVTVTRVVHTQPAAKVYYVSVEGGKAVEKVMEPELIA